MDINFNRQTIASQTAKLHESILYWTGQAGTNKNMPTIKTMLSILLTYSLLLLVIFLFQRKMIYFPDTVFA